MRVLSAAAFALAITSTAAIANTPIQPGQWEVRSTVTAVDMPGAPPQMLQMMKKPQTMRHCITAEQAARGPQELLRQSKGECKFTKYALAGGRMDAVMQCNSGKGNSMTATTRGSYTPTSYEMTSTMVMNGPQGKMTMSSKGTARRLGPCAK